jgi:ABC-type antimicrobial peptide transport system permease subunit
MYVPIAQIPDGVTTLNVRLLPLVWIVRTAPEPYSLARPIKQALESASGGLPVFRVRSMSDVVSASTARRRFDMWLMTIFGCIAMTLAAIGIYGLIAYVVRQRTHEIGIRLALGQDPRGVRNVILKQGLSTAVVGTAIGAAAAFAAARVLASLLFSVKPHDPVIFTLTLLTFLAVAAGACYIPARRATKVDPLVAIRYE